MQRFEFILNMFKLVLGYFERRSERKRKEKEERQRREKDQSDSEESDTFDKPITFKEFIFLIQQDKETLYFLAFNLFIFSSLALVFYILSR